MNFLNNDQNFRFQNNSIDETLLACDGIHLSQQGVSRLIQNLALQEKAEPGIGVILENAPQATVPNGDTGLQVTPTTPQNLPARTSQIPSTALAADSPVKFRGANNTFSNFYMTPIKVWSISFKSTEHAYNYRKALEMAQHSTAEEIRHAGSGREAMAIAESISTNDHWANIKQSIMYQLLEAKAEQCSVFRRDLIASRGKLLIEDTSHEYWGRGRRGDGLNMLGRLLMVLRDNLPVSPSTQAQFPPWPRQTAPSVPMNMNQRRPFPTRRELQPRCFNCGERSHNVSTCRHKSPVQCYTCHNYGHKHKNCFTKQPDSSQSISVRR